MLLSECVKNKIEDTRIFSEKYYTLELICKKLNKNSIDECLNVLQSKINSKKYSVVLNYNSVFKMYYSFVNNKLYLSSTYNLNKYSEDNYEIKFYNKYDKVKYLFDIAGNLTMHEKLMLEENNWVKNILNSSKEIIEDLIEED